MAQQFTIDEPTLASGTKNKPILIVGVGGAGSNVIDRIALNQIEYADLVSINTDNRDLASSVSAKAIQIGRNVTRGLSTGGDPELGEKAVLDDKAIFDDLFQDREHIFFCLGLGGGTGSGATPYMTGLAKESGAIVSVFAVSPFSFEGARRISQANESLARLEEFSDIITVFENDRMGEQVVANASIQDAFANADQILSDAMHSSAQITKQPGLIRIGIDELMGVLGSNSAKCIFGYARETGKNRGQKALETVLKSPLIPNADSLKKVKNVVLHVCGSDKLTLFEVQHLMNEVQKKLSDNVEIFFGVGTDNKLGDALSLTLIASEDQKSTKPKIKSESNLKATQKEEKKPIKKEEEKPTAKSEVAEKEIKKETPAPKKKALPKKKVPKKDLKVKSGVTGFVGDLFGFSNEEADKGVTDAAATNLEKALDDSTDFDDNNLNHKEEANEKLAEKGVKEETVEEVKDVEPDIVEPAKETSSHFETKTTSPITEVDSDEEWARGNLPSEEESGVTYVGEEEIEEEGSVKESNEELSSFVEGREIEQEVEEQPQTSQINQETNWSHPEDLQSESHVGNEDLAEKSLLDEIENRPERFESTDPVIHEGEDLDIPAFLRRKKD